VSTVLAVTADLFWEGRIRAAAAALGHDVKVPARALDVTQELLHEDTRLVLVDLHHPRVDFVDTIRLVRGTRWDARLVCFGHHTDAARMEAARAAGATEVWPNSELDRRLPELLRGL
jgi:DNA-binding NarL/FixJ family response regulator